MSAGNLKHRLSPIYLQRSVLLRFYISGGKRNPLSFAEPPGRSRLQIKHGENGHGNLPTGYRSSSSVYIPYLLYVQQIRLTAKILLDTDRCGPKELAFHSKSQLAGMEAALWDALAKAANLAQLSGLHASMLVAVATSLIWNLSSRQECARLEQCARELRALLQWPTGCVAVMQQRTKMGYLVSQALRDADGLVESYNRSTLWRRVRTGRSMAAQFRETQSRIDSYCGLMLVIHGHLLIQPLNPPPSEPNTTIHQANDDPSQSVQAVTQCPTGAELPHRANDIGHEQIGRQPGSAVDPGCAIAPDIVISLHYTV